MDDELSVKTEKKNGNEEFTFNGNSLNYTLLDFWSWNNSDLLNNAMRGKIAEFIITTALLKIDDLYRIEWEEYDVLYNNLKIEVKSGAYIQSWEQDKFSNIIFGIRPTQDYNGTEFRRQSDIYIFALLKHKDAKTISPLKLEQWNFYIVKTQELDNKLGPQKTIALNSLLNLDHIKCSYSELKENIDKIKNSI